MKLRTLLSAAALLAAGAQAGEAPSGAEVKRVLDYYYSAGDTGTPVLVDFKLCADVHRDGEQRYNCKDEIDRASLEVGTSLYAWMNFMVPKAEKGEVLLQLKHDGVIRGARRAPVEGAIRYRTWRRIDLTRAGVWELPILYDDRRTVRNIDTVTLTVNEPLVTRLYEDTGE